MSSSGTSDESERQVEDIPMSRPDVGAAEIEAVARVLETPHLSLGPRLDEFEEAFARYVGTRHAVAVSSGTAGLHLCIVAAGVGGGDLVLTTPFSFVASANVALYQGAVPVFVDIDPDTLALDVDLVAGAAQDLASGGRAGWEWLPPAVRSPLEDVIVRGPLRAILPVHVFGRPAELQGLLEVAREHDLVVIEDACEAVGARDGSRYAGTLGDAGVYAFYPNKQMTTGEGGMVVTDRDDWDALLRSLRNQGRDVFDVWLRHERLGYNYRMDELSAALGLAQLGRIEELLERRRRVAGWYTERLRELPGVRVPDEPTGPSVRSWFVYVVRLAARIDRGAVMAALQERGVPSRPYFTPIHLQPFYRERLGYQEGDFPVTEAVARSTLALPFFGRMEERQVERVCGCLQRVLEETGRAEAHPTERDRRRHPGEAGP